ncbi:MAG: RNA methyltransferase [Gammaproteobacteria bacterium]|nr:RNA methyltransferase [Gammaproteobacteria bacterium]MDH5693513.1 RNA methyltransferase [Gammaproteobacteria bacterium]
MTLDNVRWILLETSDSGNIGAAARALKTMGFSRLVLVNPKDYPSAKATARASGADDVLDQAEVYDTLQQALGDSRWVFGTSARLRNVQWPQFDPRQASLKAGEIPAEEGIAIVFGREDSGLSNEELSLCHFLIHIPTNSEYQSLNLGAAVQVLAYELNMMRLAQSESLETETRVEEAPATAEQVNGFYQRMETVLLEIGFLKPPSYHKLLRRLKRLFNRAQPTETELHILHGILTAAVGRKYAWQTRKDLGNGDEDSIVDESDK